MNRRTGSDHSEQVAGRSDWRRVLLYYIVSAIIVTGLMRLGSPEQLCVIADGITESVSRVDAFYVINQTYLEYQRENRLAMNYQADYGGVSSMNPYSTGVGLYVTSIFRGIRNTLAADWATLIISFLSFLLSLVIIFRYMKAEFHLITVLLTVLAAGLIAFIIKYALLLVAYPFGCGGQFMLAWLSIWPIFKAGLEIREMAQRVERASGLLGEWFNRKTR